MLHFIIWIIFGATVGLVAAILHDEKIGTKRGLAFILAGTLGGLAGGLGGLALSPDIDNYDAQAGGMSFSIFGAIAFVLLAQLVSHHGNSRSNT